MKEAKSKITTKKSGNRGYKSAWIYIPSKIYKSESFPFREDEEIIIDIEDENLIQILDMHTNTQLNETIPKILNNNIKDLIEPVKDKIRERYNTYNNLNKKITPKKIPK